MEECPSEAALSGTKAVTWMVGTGKEMLCDGVAKEGVGGWSALCTRKTQPESLSWGGCGDKRQKNHPECNRAEEETSAFDRV